MLPYHCCCVAVAVAVAAAAVAVAAVAVTTTTTPAITAPTATTTTNQRQRLQHQHQIMVDDSGHSCCLIDGLDHVFKSFESGERDRRRSAKAERRVHSLRSVWMIFLMMTAG